MTEMIPEAYLSEIFSSFQGEGGMVRGSCFGKRQIFLRFYGCNLAEGSFGSKGCFWCDSPQARTFGGEWLHYEAAPGSKQLIKRKNPLLREEIVEIVNSLRTPDLHSISFTGGEPLCQLEAILSLVNDLEELKLPLYLETNGSLLPTEDQMERLSEVFEYCCCDIKDRSARAASEAKWDDLVQAELCFIENMVAYGIDTFAKLIVTSQTSLKDLEKICKALADIRYSDGQPVGLAIQPVTLENEAQKKKYSTSHSQLNQMFATAGKILAPECLTLSIQVHKYLNIL